MFELVSQFDLQSVDGYVNRFLLMNQQPPLVHVEI